MPQMTDPSHALASFQQAYDAGLLQSQLRPGLLDGSIHLHVDQPAGRTRFIYFRIDHGVVMAMVMFAAMDPFEERPRVQLGYAVHPDHRGKGQAKALLGQALAEFQNGFAGYPPLFVEAVVDVDNRASNTVAATVFPEAPAEIEDELSGRPALLYRRLITPPAQRA